MQHTVSYSLSQSFPFVYNTILDLQDFGDFHPYMTETEKLVQTEEYTEYEVWERVFIFGFIPMRPNYKAKVFEIEKGKHIRYTSMVQNFVPLVIDFHFSQENPDGPVEIREEIELKGNKMIAGILMRMMKKTHQVIFTEIEKMKY